MSAYTHRAPRYSYFFGSSNGGRDALMAVQRYPNAFDGVIADAPSADWTHNAFSWLWSEDAEFGNPAATIAAAKLPAIQAAALAQCDAKDSTVDGVVNDPRLCRFDPSVLLCSAAETDSCLTAEQIMALDSILSGPVNPRTGQRIYPGFEPFAVATPTFWDRWVTGNATVPGGGNALLANHFFANMVFNTDSASFDHTKVNFDGDVALTNRTSIAGQWLSHVINATSPDLSRFRARNGKLLLYIGWEDPVVPPRGMIAYYESVVAKLHSDSASAASDDDALRHKQQFFRLFMVPGMGHFTGGPGATAFGALYGAPGLRSIASTMCCRRWKRGSSRASRPIVSSPPNTSTTIPPRVCCVRARYAAIRNRRSGLGMATPTRSRTSFVAIRPVVRTPAARMLDCRAE